MAEILVIEDTLAEAAYISKCLRSEGYQVTVVNTAEDAKKIAFEQKFAAILMDIVLPDGSGFGLCRYFKKKTETKDIPIIMCTSKSGEIDKEWGTKQGAAAYITKPVDSETIAATLKNLI